MTLLNTMLLVVVTKTLMLLSCRVGASLYDINKKYVDAILNDVWQTGKMPHVAHYPQNVIDRVMMDAPNLLKLWKEQERSKAKVKTEWHEALKKSGVQDQVSQCNNVLPHSDSWESLMLKEYHTPSKGLNLLQQMALLSAVSEDMRSRAQYIEKHDTTTRRHSQLEPHMQLREVSKEQNIVDDFIEVAALTGKMPRGDLPISDGMKRIRLAIAPILQIWTGPIRITRPTKEFIDANMNYYSSMIDYWKTKGARADHEDSKRFLSKEWDGIVLELREMTTKGDTPEEQQEHFDNRKALYNVMQIAKVKRKEREWRLKSENLTKNNPVDTSDASAVTSPVGGKRKFSGRPSDPRSL